MKVLVTGGAGFIGSHVADAYLARGHELAVLDDLSTGRLENVPRGARLVQGNITDAGAVDRLVAGFKPQVINHHAAQINVRHSVDDPAFDASVNILGTINLAQAAVRHSVARFIFASSGGAIYGEQEEYPAGEGHPTRPLSPYGVSKLAGEKYLDYYGQVHGLAHVILRYANVYGPRQDPRGEAGVVAIFFSRMLAGEQPIINGDGGQTRDYIYVEDVAAANVLAAEKEIEGTFNIGTGRETSVNKLFSMTNDFFGGRFTEVHGPPMKGEQIRSAISSRLFAERAGWKASTELPEGLKKTLNYFSNRQKGL